MQNTSDTNNELQELIDMAKERVGDLLSDEEILEVASSVLKELQERNQRRIEYSLDDSSESEE